MITPGRPAEARIRINSKTYFIARGVRGSLLYHTQAQGKELTEDFDFRLPSDGMGEVVRHAPNSKGEHYTNNIDTTARGLRLEPKINSITLAGAPLSTSLIEFWEDVGGGSQFLYVMYATSATNVRIYKINASTDAEEATSQVNLTFTSDGNLSPGRPERFVNASKVPKTYICVYSGALTDVDCLKELTTITSAGSGTPDTYTAIDAVVSVSLLLRQDASEGTAALLRGFAGNQVNSVPHGTNPLVNANWAPTTGYDVGDLDDVRGKFTGGASYAGYTLLAKPDSVWAFDPGGNAYSVLKFPTSRSGADLNNGHGTYAWGDRTYYPHQSGLYRIIDVSRIETVGIDDIPGYAASATTLLNAVGQPIKGHNYEGTYWGKWHYRLYQNRAASTFILAMKVERHPHTGFENKWYTIIHRDTQDCRGIFIDSKRKLRWFNKTANAIEWIQLADDGSPDYATSGGVVSRGAADSTVRGWAGPEVDFGEPAKVKQLRWAHIEMEGGVATAPWNVVSFLDGGSATQIGATFDGITAGETSPITRNPTVGTTDTFNRIRFGFRVSPNGSFVTTSDPRILRLVVQARTADVWRVVLKHKDPANVRGLFEISKALRKLKDAGPITLREPATNETFTAYIVAVNEIMYESDDGPQRGIEVIYERFAVAA